jgi:hypothetical protein
VGYVASGGHVSSFLVFLVDRFLPSLVVKHCRGGRRHRDTTRRLEHRVRFEWRGHWSALTALSSIGGIH